MKIRAAILLAVALYAATGCKKSGELTNSDAERTIKKAFPSSGNFTVSVSRIHEIPIANMAEVDATLDGFLHTQDGQPKPYSGFGRADFQHFNTGWALKQLRIDNGFGGSIMFDVDQPVE